MIMSRHTSGSDSSVLDVATDLARVSSRTALRYFRQDLAVELKGDASPVTDADKQIEREAREHLRKLFPEHGILGEEFGAGNLEQEHVWVIDPIDGTRSFISGHPLFGFLLAYLQGGECELGVISMPALNELYLGERGQGATCNGVAIHTSSKRELSHAIFSVNEGEKLFAHERNVFEQLLLCGHTRRFGYDCYPHALLSAGHIDVVIDYDLKPFDYLPLVALIEAAGGCITDWQGRGLDFHSDGRVVCSATPELHKQILKLLACAE